MQVLNMTECKSVEGAGIPKIVVEIVMALSNLDANAGQSGGQISDTPAA
jgi:hypothetical protein